MASTHNNKCECYQLQVLPGAGETYVLGALRAQQVFVQRNRVREALQVVDPVSRAVRQTTAVIRRQYRVPGPNSLW